MTYKVAFIVIPSSIKSKVKCFQYIGAPHKWEYDKEKDVWYALYAWTTDKSLMKEFKNQRNSKFFLYKKIKVDDNDSRKKELVSDLELKRMEYSSNKDGSKTNIVSTMFEYETSTDEQIVTELFLADYKLVDPLLFNPNFQSLLEMLGYSYLFFSYSDSVLSEDFGDKSGSYAQDLADRYDVFWNNYSYKDMSGRYITENNIVGNSMILNEFNSFVHLFRILFK